ncbi:DUF6893 family small protein [Streptosporangium carneum]|uniref:Uncharacterized protein n=1 Tax=Streptosporangium carneum TaxID=47481 RepID=A0A9W6MCE9_9ACTN|nr:hypothetical protein [Streptosporangium carneum]GLK08967.1 hypothetical protein GCM10017600_23730 [Streptosporangium carneum]
MTPAEGGAPAGADRARGRGRGLRAGAGRRSGGATDRDGTRRRPRRGAGALRRLLVAALVIGAGVVVYQVLPDVRRYLRIREM